MEAFEDIELKDEAAVAVERRFLSFFENFFFLGTILMAASCPVSTFLASLTRPEDPLPRVLPSFQGPMVSRDLRLEDFVGRELLLADSACESLFVASATDWTTWSSCVFWGERERLAEALSIAFLAALLALLEMCGFMILVPSVPVIVVQGMLCVYVLEVLN